MINSCSQNMFTFHFSSLRLVKIAYLSTHSTSARQYPLTHRNKKNGKWLFLRSLVSLHPQHLYAIVAPPNQQLAWNNPEDWRLDISDLCFWSGCLLICHKCVSASLRNDLIRQQSPLFSSSPISWDGRRGSSVVIFEELSEISRCRWVRFHCQNGQWIWREWDDVRKTHKRSG